MSMHTHRQRGRVGGSENEEDPGNTRIDPPSTWRKRLFVSTKRTNVSKADSDSLNLITNSTIKRWLFLKNNWRTASPSPSVVTTLSHHFIIIHTLVWIDLGIPGTAPLAQIAPRGSTSPPQDINPWPHLLQGLNNPWIPQ